MFKNKIVIKGTMVAKSGIKIGGYKDEIGISATDNPIVRNPLTGAPYIPGSSIKGKMRSLLEWSGYCKGKLYTEKMDKNKKEIVRIYHPCQCGSKNCVVCKLFGAHKADKGDAGQPRLIFRDIHLSSAFAELDNVVEIKAETAISRKDGTAADHTLREFERIAEGVTFDYEIDLITQDGDNDDELLATLITGLHMIEATGLGGKISAGYGQVDFQIGSDSYSVTKTKFSEV